MSKAQLALLLVGTAILGTIFGWLGSRLAGDGGAVGGIVLACALGTSVGTLIGRHRKGSSPH